MMYKKLLVAILLGTVLNINAQNSTEKELETIETPEQIETFLQAKKSKKNKLITFNAEKHKTILAKELFKLSRGGIKTVKTDYNKTIYKIINKTETPYYRMGYIVLNENELDMDHINSLRENIIAKYNGGTPFNFLAKQYSMDKNATRGGDTSWVKKSDNTYEFEEMMINDTHDLNDIFTVNMPESKHYYVFLKSHEPKKITEIEVLKIVEALN